MVDPHNGRREPTPQSDALTSTHAEWCMDTLAHAYACMHTHTYNNNSKNNTNSNNNHDNSNKYFNEKNIMKNNITEKTDLERLDIAFQEII